MAQGDGSPAGGADAVAGSPRQGPRPAAPGVADSGFADPAARPPERIRRTSRLAVRTIAAGIVVIIGAGSVTAASRRSGSAPAVANSPSAVRSSPAPAKALGLAAAAYATTISARSAKITSTFTLRFGASAMESTGTGVYAWDKKQGEFTTRLRYAGVSASDPATAPSVAPVPARGSTSSRLSVVGSTSVSATAIGRISAVTQRTIYDGANTYIQDSGLDLSPAVISALKLPTGNEWAESTWSNPTPASLLDWGAYSLLGSTSGQIDPRSILALLRDSATSVTNLGQVSLAGTSTTRYRATIPLLSLLPVPPAQKAVAERVLGDRTIPVDFWVDPQGRLRRVTTSLPLPAKTTSTAPPSAAPAAKLLTIGSVTVTLRLSSYGVPVNVTPPPASQIIARLACSASDDGFSCTGPG